MNRDPRSNFQDSNKMDEGSDVVLQMPATWLTLVDVHMWSTDRESKIQVFRIQQCRTIVSPIAYFTFSGFWHWNSRITWADFKITCPASLGCQMGRNIIEFGVFRWARWARLACIRNLHPRLVNCTQDAKPRELVWKLSGMFLRLDKISVKSGDIVYFLCIPNLSSRQRESWSGRLCTKKNSPDFRAEKRIVIWEIVYDDCSSSSHWWHRGLQARVVHMWWWAHVSGAPQVS